MNNDNNIKRHIERVRREFNIFGMRKYLNLLAIRNSERDVTLTITPVGSNGTSYTDGKKISITLWSEFFTKKFAVIKTAMEAFTAHEAEHVRSSNFPDQVRCSEEVGLFYNRKYGYNKDAAAKLGGTLYNIVEDGRIERIAANRFPGLVRGLKLVNAVVYQQDALDVNEERNMYTDFITAIHCLAKTGLKPKNWDILYFNNEQDDLLNQIAYIIYDATCSDFTEDVVKAVLKINEIIDPWIHEAIEKDSEFMDQLEKMNEEAGQGMNSAGQQAAQAGSNGGSGISLNSPQGIPEQGTPSQNSSGSAGNKSNQGGGVSNQNGAKTAEEAANSANDIEKTVEDLEQEINNDENLEKEIQEHIQSNEEANKANSDDEVSQSELDKMEETEGLNFGDTEIEHFQQALEESEAYEVDENISKDGNMIFNRLKNLFIKQNDVPIRRQKHGKLDISRLASMTAMRRVGQVEDRIFYKVNKKIEVSCAAYIIADTSGSTCGYIFDEVMKACAKMEIGFAKLIPFKIAAYDSNANFRFRVIRDFNNKSGDVNLSYNFMKHERAGGGTPTAEAMALAGYELKKRKEKNKLMIILTDGSPDNQYKVKEQCHKLRKEGIKVISILIQERGGYDLSSSFNDMYEGRDIIKESPEFIADRLMNILEKWIIASFKN